MNKYLKICISGLLGGFVGEGVMGMLFMCPPIHSILYDPDLQSPLFISVTTQRDLMTSIGGMVMLSIVHSWLYSLFIRSIPGTTSVKKGLFWGFTIWLMYWLFQEWFIYHTLLHEPILLNVLELSILLTGSLVEGVVIGWFFRKELESI